MAAAVRSYCSFSCCFCAFVLLFSFEGVTSRASADAVA